MLEKTLRLYTPSLSEKALAEFLADKCDDLGFENIRIDDVGNLIATKGSGSPKILLCGHMDTVPGKIKVRNENGFIYGRGASDAKAPLMAMLSPALVPLRISDAEMVSLPDCRDLTMPISSTIPVNMF